MANLNYTAAQIEAFLENVDAAGARKVGTTHFVRSVGTNPMTAVTTIPVTITVNGVAKTGSITKNANGDILTLFCADMNENNAMAYIRSDPSVHTPYTTIDTRTKNIGTTEVNQQRVITRNAAREIISITPWTNV
jgi:hypothetical protein